jgi:hypothetical protein
MELIPSPFEIDEKVIKCSPHPIFAKEEMSCSMINNVGTFVFQILGLLALKCVFSILAALTTPKKIKTEQKLPRLERVKSKVERMMEEQIQNKTKSRNIFEKANDFLSIEFFANYMMAIQLDVVMGACITIKNASIIAPLRAVDLLIAIIFFICYTCFLGFIIKMTHKIATYESDRLMKTHYKTYYKNWLFIIEPLIELKLEREAAHNLN